MRLFRLCLSAREVTTTRLARAVISAGLWLFMSAVADAQTLTSNRPGIGDSEILVPRGALQIEGGVAIDDAPPSSETAWIQTWGELNVRVGVRAWLEVFAGWDGLSRERIQVGANERIVSGGNDVRIGAKLAVLDEVRHGVTLSLAPAWSFPTGADQFSSGSNDGSLRMLWARSLPGDWAVSGNLLFNRTSDEDGRYWDNQAMLGLTRMLNDAGTLSAFAEIAAVVLGGRPDMWTMDGGVAWVARRNLQWDVSAGHTFDNRANDWFVSAGITVRVR